MLRYCSDFRTHSSVPDLWGLGTVTGEAGIGQ